MNTRFYTNFSDTKFLDRLKGNLDTCSSFDFSVSFIKKPGLSLIGNNIKAALARGAKGRVITSTYQNFTDVESLLFFDRLQRDFPGSFECHLDNDSFVDRGGNVQGFHSKGYIFEFGGKSAVDGADGTRDRDGRTNSGRTDGGRSDDGSGSRTELMVGSSNITVYALLKNVEWDVSVIDDDRNIAIDDARAEFEYLWKKTTPINQDIIDAYRARLYYSIERWDMDYDVANNDVKPNYMQRRALKELNRIRMMGASKALVVSAAGSGKTYLAAFDAFNFMPKRLLYIVHEGSILMKSYETFQKVFKSDRSYGIYNKDYKELDRDFVFSTNVTMAGSLEMFDRHDFDYIVIDECHHATAETYRRILEYFEPEFLLGITATPERMDGEDVFELFGQNVPFELRLRDAIVNRLVVPFHYYGIRDTLIKYGISDTRGHKFVEQFSDEEHCEFIRDQIEAHREHAPAEGAKPPKLKALAFCRDISHAARMADAMSDYYNTRYLTGKNSTGERIRAYKDLQDESSDLEILFTVDILNEGVDIPGVNMVLFLRPTDSQTIFIQQLGRGLRMYEGKKYVTVLDFIGNDYKRSVQIAFAFGSMSKNFVVEKKLVAALVKDDYKELGLSGYGVDIQIDDLSKEEILGYIDEVNFNTKQYQKQDYENFKKYIGAETYPSHVDYLNNDFAPDLIKLMQSKIGGKKNKSYYGFLRGIGEENLPDFNDRQEAFIEYLSEMLPLVRPYEYLIVQYIMENIGKATVEELTDHLKRSVEDYSPAVIDHAIKYMIESGFFTKSDDTLYLSDVVIDSEFDGYVKDLLEYGLGQYDIDFGDSDKTSLYKLWGKYRKEQVQQLLLKNPKDIMVGTKNYGGYVYIYVTVEKANSVKEELKYMDGYLDKSTFQWESVSNISDAELNGLKNSNKAHLFVRKVESEDNITLPFTYIGSGNMQFIEGSKQPNGSYMFRIAMDEPAPEDLYFDFKLPE